MPQVRWLMREAGWLILREPIVQRRESIATAICVTAQQKV